MGLTHCRRDDIAQSLGEFATLPKDSLMPDVATLDEADALIEYLNSGGKLLVHGMAMIAFDDRLLYVNGSSTALPAAGSRLISKICRQRSLSQAVKGNGRQAEMLVWMLRHGAFEYPVHS
jgi:hypothetical protein